MGTQMPLRVLVLSVGLITLVAAAACANNAAPAATTAPTAIQTTTSVPKATSAPADVTATQSGQSLSTASATTVPTGPRTTGQVDGVVFKVGTGSKATFTVREELVRVPVPIDAVLSTTDLKGDVRLDGWPSAIVINLHALTSDQPNRDRYVRNNMFPQHPTATLTIADVTPLPDGFTEGHEVTTRLTGTLSVRGVDVPIDFDIEARDDGDVVYVVARAEFTWEELDMTEPRASVVVSIDDTVRVEVLLALRPA